MSQSVPPSDNGAEGAFVETPGGGARAPSSRVENRGLLWVLALALTLVPLYLLFIYLPGGTSDTAKRGQRELGSVMMKDSGPGPNGATVYTVTFVFQDTLHRNHMVTRRMEDAGAWERLKRNGDVRVIYLPEKPDEATIEGAEGMVPKHSGSLRFLAWSLLAASAYFWLRLWMTKGQTAPPAKPSGPRVTMARR